MKDMVQSTTFVTAGQVYHASVASSSMEVLAMLPKERVHEHIINSNDYDYDL